VAENPPYMNAYGSISKVLERIIEAKRPERFTQDYLETVLGLPSSSLRPVIPLLKRIGFLNQDGSPTEIYSKFKTEGGRKAAMASALKIGFPEIFKRNEYANKLDKSKLTDVVVEMTGLERNNPTIRNIVGTFSALNEHADFDQDDKELSKENSQVNSATDRSSDLPISHNNSRENFGNLTSSNAVGMNLAYTINLNLPESTNIEVFNTIFRALKENLLK
jgi:hypothetical protein